MVVDEKDAPPARTYRAEYDAPQGLPPAYQQQGSSNPFVRTPSPAARGYPPSPGYDAPSSGEAAPFYGQRPAPAQGSSSQYLSPGPSSGQARSPSPGGSSSGFFNKSASLASLLDPPPPAFARAPQPQLPYGPFAPCAATSLTAGLDGGFPPVPPAGPAGAPHPFATHDVREEDWARFLGDLKKVATLSGANRVVSNVAPLMMHAGASGFFITRALEKRMKRQKVALASRLVEYWNNYYFHPRMMEVTLVHGRTVYGSSAGLPQEMVSQGYRRREDLGSDADESDSDSDSDSSSSSSSDSEDNRRPPSRDERLSDKPLSKDERKAAKRASKDARKAEKRTHKAEKKAEKRERKDEKRADRRARKEERREVKRERKSKRSAEKAERKEPWKLIVSYKPASTM